MRPGRAVVARPDRRCGCPRNDRRPRRNPGRVDARIPAAAGRLHRAGQPPNPAHRRGGIREAPRRFHRSGDETATVAGRIGWHRRSGDSNHHRRRRRCSGGSLRCAADRRVGGDHRRHRGRVRAERRATVAEPAGWPADSAAGRPLVPAPFDSGVPGQQQGAFRARRRYLHQRGQRPHHRRAAAGRAAPSGIGRRHPRYLLDRPTHPCTCGHFCSRPATLPSRCRSSSPCSGVDGWPLTSWQPQVPSLPSRCMW